MIPHPVSHPASSPGVALVLVLAFLVLISGLVVSFFTSVTNEFTAAKTYSDGVTTRQLADSAVGVVMGQIREASSRPNGAWASQPGMIRVYRDGSAAGPKASAFYKLYSSDNMVVTAAQIAEFDPLEDDVPETWKEQPALFSDLNAPVTVRPSDDPGAAPEKRYPILDPSAQTEVEGFGFAADKRDDPSDPGRMPARWIYVLRDGTLSAPAADLSTGMVARWNASGVLSQRPTKENPVVGRIAFWTDDDTSKVNINTASGMPGDTDPKFAGSFWDTPRVSSEFDKGKVNATSGAVEIPSLALCQPGQKEYQRYPGHPATTSLGVVFGKLLDSEQLYKLAPRVVGGGSLGGKVGGAARMSGSLAPDSDRLYASVDELVFAPKSTGSTRLTSDAALGSATPKLTEQVLAKRRFFLTAHSRAPELNLHGRPRVTIWPFYEKPNASASENESRRTPYDRLIAFCSTIRESSPADRKRFLFSRYEPYSPTADALVPRNLALYNYLREVTGKKNPIPGFSGSFETKYQSGATNDRDQILTEIFDYIRCVNLRDTSADKPGETAAVTDGRKFAPIGIVVPTQIKIDGKDTTGFGRFPTISEAALVFYRAKRLTNDPVGAVRMRAFLVFETFNPLQGYTETRSPTGVSTRVVHEIAGLDQLKVETNAGSAPLGFAKTARNEILLSSGSTWHGRNFGGNEGFMHTLQGKPGGTNYALATPNPGVLIPAAEVAAGFRFGGGKATLRVLFNSQQIQTITLNFPNSAGGANWPVPTEDYDKTSTGSFFKSGTPDHVYDVEQRIRWAQQSSYAEQGHAERWMQILQPGDTIRSLEVSAGPAGSNADPRGGGDMRVTSVLDAVDRFAPHVDYLKNARWAHSLRTSLGVLYHPNSGFAWTKLKFGNIAALLTGQTYPANISADIPVQINGVTRSDGKPGDFDTGIGSLPDGPFCNKVDEGNNVFKYVRLGEDVYPIPYFGTEQFVPPGDTYFSPNRQMPSAGMFGSLLSRNAGHQPWETLLFCPNPAGPDHRGNTVTPKDHLLLDLFHMPVVEPYAISEPFSTAGKVNLNYQIAPFSYIKRSTALRAALKATRVTAIPSTAFATYKTSNTTTNYRLELDRDETIKAIDHFFSQYASDRNGGFFKSTSEICDRYLYPKGVKFAPGEAAMLNFWKLHTLTGDNVREKPYTDLYPRLTTKSNTYTVHVRVQTLRKRPSNGDGKVPPDEHYATWEEGRDQVVGEYRGSTTIERYLDPDDRRFNKTHSETAARKDFLDADLVSLEDAYRFRVIATKKFAP